jgi:hypothetical protein
MLYRYSHIEKDLQSLFGINVHSCTHWLLRPATPPFPPHLGSSYTRALLVSQEIDDVYLSICNPLPIANDIIT